MGFAYVLANKEVITWLRDPGKRNHRGSTALHAVVRVALHVPACQECRLSQGLGSYDRALSSAAVYPQLDHGHSLLSGCAHIIDGVCLIE